MNSKQARHPTSRTAFLSVEEECIIEILQRFADKGVPMSRKRLIAATALFVLTLPTIRKRHVLFKNGRPGVLWMRWVYERHKSNLSQDIPNSRSSFISPLRTPKCSPHTARLCVLLSARTSSTLREFGISGRLEWVQGETRGIQLEWDVFLPQSNGRCSDANICLHELSYSNDRCVCSRDIRAITLDFKAPYSLPQFRHQRHRITRDVTQFPITWQFDLPGTRLTKVVCVQFLSVGNWFTSYISRFVTENRKCLLTYDAYRS